MTSYFSLLKSPCYVMPLSFTLVLNLKTPSSQTGLPGGSDGSKESACNSGDPDSISGSGRFPGEGNILA